MIRAELDNDHIRVMPDGVTFLTLSTLLPRHSEYFTLWDPIMAPMAHLAISILRSMQEMLCSKWPSIL